MVLVIEMTGLLFCFSSDYSQGYPQVVAYSSRDSVNSLPQRGSPDGASSRAESPPANNRSSNFYEARKLQKQLKMDQNYNQFARQYVVDQPRLPTTLPPSYPGTTNQMGAIYSTPDVIAGSNLSSRENFHTEQLV